MKKRNRGIPALASLLLLLGACDLRLNEHVMRARESVDLRQPNRVDLVQFDHRIDFEGGRDRPTEAELDRFDAFASSINLGYADEVVLRGSTPSRRNVIVGYIERSAIPAAVRTEPGSKEETASNAVKVVVNRYVVTPPSCPDWSNFNGNDNRNTPGSHYGCSVDSSLGYMVANPRDLVQGQTIDPAYSNPMIRTLRAYEAGQALKPERQGTGANN